MRLARKMMGVLRGDKYLVGAYPPEWAASSMPDTAAQTDTTAADATSAARSKAR